jgi:hypothetical protein
VHQIPSNELLAGNTARQEPTADLSPVSEVSTHAVSVDGAHLLRSAVLHLHLYHFQTSLQCGVVLQEKPSPSPTKPAQQADSPTAPQRRFAASGGLRYAAVWIFMLSMEVA